MASHGLPVAYEKSNPCKLYCFRRSFTADNAQILEQMFEENTQSLESKINTSHATQTNMLNDFKTDLRNTEQQLNKKSAQMEKKSNLVVEKMEEFEPLIEALDICSNATRSTKIKEMCYYIQNRGNCLLVSVSVQISYTYT